MSQDIVQEVTFFLHSILVGLVITFLYDWILILRKLVKHGIGLVSLEDFIFWFVCGIGVFYMLYRENNGTLRWFAVAGAALGMLLYKAVIKDRFIYIMSTCIHKIMWFIFRLIQIVLKPLKCVFSAVKGFLSVVQKKLRKWKQNIKKRLTVCIKMLKMVLCKH
jgi:spore cortex biosynthesis protein YabQ